MSKTDSEKVRDALLSGLQCLGYRGGLLAVDYGFADYFAPGRPERRVAAAAFGQTPVSYDSACIGVIEGGGIQGAELVDQYRALGAPVVLEIGGVGVREWAVSRLGMQHALLGTYPADRLNDLFVRRGTDWTPAEFLRAKNIGFFHWEPQLSLFAGLIPELEAEIQEKLAPLLHSSLSDAKQAYRQSLGKEPDPRQLFKLVFWLLTAKVFRDRHVGFFDELALSDGADAIISAVAKHYKAETPKLLNREARHAAVAGIWGSMDFRNLSGEVLSQIWADLLVDDSTREQLGIHRTSRTIVRYVVDRLSPFETRGDDKRIVLEPCCGSGVFLVGAMNALRHSLFGMAAQERHIYYIKHLAGIEKEPFGVEISRLALTLADFPNPDGWDIQEGDVFAPQDLRPLVRRAGIVLCNPPFRDFNAGERASYRPISPRQPEELLNRILNDLPPDGVLGFVLPRVIVDGAGYASLRRRLAERFAYLELTVLPDRAFEGADAEVGLLIAKEPIPHDVCRVSNIKVEDNTDAWNAFVHSYRVSGSHDTYKTPYEISESLAIPELSEVWDFLRTYRTLGSMVTIARGIRWNQPLLINGQETGFRNEVVRDAWAEGFHRGIPPRAKFGMFEKPPTKFLDFRKKHRQFGAFILPWDQPKVILNKSTRSRGRWRLAAYPDIEGLACYQTFFAIWPKPETMDIWSVAAVLNSPIANAFVATREGKTDNTMEVVSRIPTPYLAPAQFSLIKSLVIQYQNVVHSSLEAARAGDILMEIDAAVLAGYRLPPKVEHQLLEWFRGHERRALDARREYFPKDSDVFFSLSDRLSPDFEAATAGELLKRLAVD